MIIAVDCGRSYVKVITGGEVLSLSQKQSERLA